MPRALILAPQRRSMVSSSPITTGAPDGTKAFTSRISSWRAAARDDHAARLRIRWKVQKSRSRFASQDAQRRRDGSPAGRQDDAGEQHQNVRPGRTREQIGEPHEPRQKAFRQWRPRRAGEKMRVLHLIGRIGALNRGNIAPPRQIESACPSGLARARRNRHIDRYDQTRPALAQIAAQFTRHDVEWSRGAYTIIDRCTANPVARLRPIPDTDRFELFYWSNVKGPLDDLRKPRPHEAHARERSRDR